jgi:hypothetical protein
VEGPGHSLRITRAPAISIVRMLNRGLILFPLVLGFIWATAQGEEGRKGCLNPKTEVSAPDPPIGEAGPGALQGNFGT